MWAVGTVVEDNAKESQMGSQDVRTKINDNLASSRDGGVQAFSPASRT